MGDSWTGATPMRNSDFKALLTTPRTTGGTQQQQREGSSFKHPCPKVPADPDRDKKFKKPHPKRPGKPGAAGDKEKEGEEGPLYRDRAKERRDGLNVDFADAEQELAARGLGPTALQSLSIEQSKFLGGDIAHTHLVKGLDYALLNQQRQKLESGSSDGGSGAAQSAAAAAAAAAAAEATAAAQKAAVKFSTPLGRSVYHAVFRPAGGNRNLVREMFQPRRTAFVFEFGEGGGDVPTTLRRSKADCPAVQDVVSAVSDAHLLERISKVMGYINQTSVKGGKRSARDSQYIRSILTGVNPAAPGEGQVHGQLVMKGQAALSAAAAAAGGPAAAAGQPGGQPAAAAATAAGGGDVEDDDIFGDAGTDYAPALPQKKEAGGSRRAEGLFENSDHQADLVLPPPPAVGDGGGGEVDMDIEEGELPGQQRRQQQAAAAAAAAAQGYPGYPAPGAAGDYYQQQQQAGWQQQQYGQAAAPQQEQPKWRVSTKPGAAGASSSASTALQGFADEAYAECFPTMADYNVVEEDEEEDPKKARAAAAAAAAAGEGAPGGGGKGGKGGRGGGGGGGLDDAEKKLHSKLSREVQQMQGFFDKKGWGTEAFKKERKEDNLDAVAATPARKRLRI